jgi:hypothetical protein
MWTFFGNRFVEAHIHGNAQVKRKNLWKCVLLCDPSVTTWAPELKRVAVLDTERTIQLVGPERNLRTKGIGLVGVVGVVGLVGQVGPRGSQKARASCSRNYFK